MEWCDLSGLTKILGGVSCCRRQAVGLDSLLERNRGSAGQDGRQGEGI